MKVRNAKRSLLSSRSVQTGVLTGVLAALYCVAAGADKGANEGAYVEPGGTRHEWRVERTHSLTWDGKPYVPAGIVFHSEFLKAPSEDTLAKDASELDRLKSAGVLDIWVEPGRGLLETKVADTQKLVDALEARGFRYGLRIGDRHEWPLVGYSPTLPYQRVPVQRLQPGQRQVFEIPAPGGRKAVYTLVESSPDERTQNWAISTGEVVVEKDQAVVDIQLKQSRLLGKSRGLLMTVPEIQVEPEDLGSFGDLWEGMEDYRARLMEYLRALKPGSGLRFLMDPFTAGDGSTGREDLVFPSSLNFRDAYADWLQKKVGIGTLNNSWRMNDRRIAGFEEAARLVPTWPRNDPPEGDGWMIDPVDHLAYRCTPRLSTVWADLDNFRAEFLKKSMNDVATSLKNEVINIPVVFSWAAYHPLFNNAPAPGGYDGLAALVFGNASSVAVDTAAYAFAQAEESDRNAWLIAARLAGPPNDAGAPGQLGGAELRQAWNVLSETGFRGVYLDPLQNVDAVSTARELAGAISSSTAALTKQPDTLFFPMPLAGAGRLTRLSNGVWWLPSGRSARLLRYGDAILGYEIDKPFGDESPIDKGTVLWSTIGKQDYTFFWDRFADVKYFDSAGKPLKMKTSKKGELNLALGSEPIVVVGMDGNEVFPLELAAAQIAELERLINQADSQRMDTASMRVILKQAQDNLVPANAAVMYNSVGQYVTMLREALRPYYWLEGERAASHNLSGIAYLAGSSGGTVLRLDRRDPPISGVYKARFMLEVRKPASYEVWVAGKAPGRPGVSPLIWQIDEEPAVEVKSATPVGGDYAREMTWFQVGRTTLQAGKHQLLLIVPDKAPGSGGRYTAAIDTVVLSRDPFKPNGIEKPVTKIVPLPKEEMEKKKGKKRDSKSDEDAKPERKKDEKKGGKKDDKQPEPSDGEGKVA